MKIARTLRAFHAIHGPRSARVPPIPLAQPCRRFCKSALLQKIQTHKLSDIGEGVKEVQIIQWFVEEGAAVEEWAPLCEVQSDKASVEITSQYTGVVKKLHFDRDAIVQVGDAMLDIEVEGEQVKEEEGDESEETKDEDSGHELSEEAAGKDNEVAEDGVDEQKTAKAERQPQERSNLQPSGTERASSGGSATLATPAVRGLLKEHNLDISDIEGTGKDGRVLKEDISRHLEGRKSSQAAQTRAPSAPFRPELDAKQVETPQNLTPIQSAMFKSMTKSLSIPHFLFSDSVNITNLATMRSRLNAARNPETTPKFTYLPFVIKAVSLALNQYPILNAKIDTANNPEKPRLIIRSNHNISVAMDTPSGLLVPVVKNVNARSITSIAQEINRLSQLGQSGKLSNTDLNGGTITVSNIGNIGGEVVAPVIVEGQLAILGLGMIKPTPVFAADGKTIERADMMSMNWSADHRVIDGATMARIAKLVQGYLEQPAAMLVDMC